MASVVLVLHGCDEATGPTVIEPESLTLVSGAEASDTVFSPDVHTLTAEVRGRTGEPVPDVPVRFAVLGPDDGPTVVLEVAGEAADSATISTDSLGRATTTIGFGGPEAGDARVAVEVPGTALGDTAIYHLLPGQPIGFRGATQDVIVETEDTVRIGGWLVDGYGNALPDTLACTTEAPEIRVVDGCLIRGVDMGVGRLIARTDTFWFPAEVTVYPAATLAYTGHLMHATARLTGLSRDRLPHIGQPWQPVWYADGDSLLVRGSGGFWVIRPEESSARPLRVVQGDTMGGTDPAFDADGEWLYYGSSTADGESRGREIWRAAPDGSGAERVGPPAAEGRYDRWPSPSPDGDRLVYASDSSGISEYDSPIRILDLETGAVRELGLSGASPAWSPAGRHIAFATDSAVMMTDPAGGGIRELVRLVRPGALAWSPDGRFLLGHYDRDPVISYYNIFVLEIETGFWLRAPLIGQTASTSRSGEVWDPAWRPTPPGS